MFSKIKQNYFKAKNALMVAPFMPVMALATDSKDLNSKLQKFTGAVQQSADAGMFTIYLFSRIIGVILIAWGGYSFWKDRNENGNKVQNAMKLGCGIALLLLPEIIEGIGGTNSEFRESIRDTAGDWGQQ